MSVTFKCQNCGATDSRSDSTLGQKTICESCQHPGVVGRRSPAEQSDHWLWDFAASCAGFGLVVSGLAVVFGFISLLSGILGSGTAYFVAAASLMSAGWSLGFSCVLLRLVVDGCRELRNIRQRLDR